MLSCTEPLVEPRHDPARLAVLRSTRLLDTEAEPAFDRLTRLAVLLLKVPAAFLSLVDDERDFYKASTGFGEPLASTRELTGPTFCHLAIASPEPLVIADTSSNEVHRAIPTVRSLGVAAYVGVPLTLDGQAIGSFCAIDSKPHEWTEVEVAVLKELGASAMAEIELRRTASDLAAANTELEVQQLELSRTNQQLNDYAMALEGRQAELELANRQLQDSAVELELQQEELTTTMEELADRTDEAEAAARRACFSADVARAVVTGSEQVEIMERCCNA
ncbi:MAG: GAF domain-containing protein, partial [Gemmatimonadaceae bacterium]